MKKAVSIILCVVLLVCAFPVAVAAKPADTPMTATSKLSAKGTSLVDGNGNEVVLKGVNLGGWLVYEGWMCAGDLQDGTELLNTLESRFGEEKALGLIKAYEENWITVDDLDKIASMGFNCVRVPFWYRNFQKATGEWYLDENGEIDLSPLEWIVDECAERGIYVVLDMHGAPGAQSVAHHAGTTGECYLYDMTAAGEQYRAETAILWKEIANRFKDCPNVAAYDLLNEPTCDMDTSAYITSLWSVYDELYRAVRTVDAKTVIAFEGVWELNNLPSPSLFGWENILYEVHLYNYSNESVDGAIDSMLKYRDYYNVPVYVGECNFGGSYEYALGRIIAEDVSFTTWTYKAVAAETDTTWFIYSGTAADADIKTASYEELMIKWSAGARTELMTENTANIELLQKAANTEPNGNITNSEGTPTGIVYKVIFIIASVYRILQNILSKV